MTVDQHGFDRTRIDSVQVVELIQVERTSGHGKDMTDPVRRFYDYYTAAGELVASCDTSPPETLAAGSAAWGDLERTHGRWRESTDDEARLHDQRVWAAVYIGDEEPRTEVTRLRCGWHIESPGRTFSLADARELVQLMEKVEDQS